MGKRRRRQANGPSGLFVVDKPVGPTSRDVVASLARRLDLPLAGHCGTLDPLASGILIVLSGYATRVQDLLMGHTKTYEANVCFGASSATDDAEGPIEVQDPEYRVDHQQLQAATSAFVGEIEQRPPALSAVHIDGERAFARVRRGESVEVPMRTVRIDSIEILGIEKNSARLRVVSGPGTYIRSLARDLGRALGVGAYLTALRRTSSGTFTLADAVELDQIASSDCRPIEAALTQVPSARVSPTNHAALLQGKSVSADIEATEGNSCLIWIDGLVHGHGVVIAPGMVRLRRLIRAPNP